MRPLRRCPRIRAARDVKVVLSHATQWAFIRWLEVPILHESPYSTDADGVFRCPGSDGRRESPHGSSGVLPVNILLRVVANRLIPLPPLPKVGERHHLLNPLPVEGRLLDICQEESSWLLKEARVGGMSPGIGTKSVAESYCPFIHFDIPFLHPCQGAVSLRVLVSPYMFRIKPNL